MMTRIELTEPADAGAIWKVYSGYAGCGCGCNGNYYEDARNIKRIVNAINKRIGSGAGLQLNDDGTPFCYYVEDRYEPWDGGGSRKGRYYWAYVR